VPKGKPANYYDKTHRGLGYVIPPTPLQSENVMTTNLSHHILYFM